MIRSQGSFLNASVLTRPDGSRTRERAAARKEAEESVRSLAGRILTLQDEEHRKIARGLHDSVGQYLAALKMNLEVMSRNRSIRPELAECLEIVDTCLNETRTISHLLHPPLLDEAGFGSAAHWYVDGFAKRSGIKVHLELPFEPLRMHADVEVALFRVLQEGLTNIYKHSKASVVDVRLMTSAEGITLKVHDNGRGIAKSRLETLTGANRECGVGIAGMRERIRELGGSLDLHSNGKGTTLSANIPVTLAYPPSVVSPKSAAAT